MKANTRGQFKAAADPRTVESACSPEMKKREPMETFQGLPQAKAALCDYPPKWFI